MPRRRAVFIVLALVLSWVCAAAARERPRPAPTVILISLDGMRPDYTQKAPMPNLERLVREGVRGGIIPPFPSLTFPAHYTIVTGLHPGHHGIVSNHMRDAQLGRYSTSDQKAITDGRWYEGEPLWVTASKQGQRSHACFWIGAEAEIAGHRPAFSLRYDASLSHEERLECLFSGLDQPAETRAAFFTLYFNDADWTGHRHGPESAEMRQALARLDAMLGRLIAGLETRGLLGQVNLLVVSDHGMAATSPEKALVLDDLLPAAVLRDTEIVHTGPLAALRSRSGQHRRLHRLLSSAQRKHAPFRVYRREETPPRWHYRHRRVPEVVALADEGYMFTTRERMGQNDWPAGMHGYDNLLASMQALFVAHGPAFRRGAWVEAFEAVHLYELVCHILGLKPAPNDGSLEAVRSLLR
jgi:predicted AlkP superfamily pyrophosphatase or phosphodiesterase